MIKEATILMLGLLLTGAAADAQEVSVPDYEGQYADALLHSRLTGRMIRQAQERRRHAAAPTSVTATRLSPRSRAICRDKQRIAAGLPRASGIRLYALCARAGL